VKIFWSWQSDRDEDTCRYFVLAALKAAVEKLKQPEAIDQPTERENRSALDVDQGAQGVPGSPDLARTIFDKILTATVFVADVTPVSVIPSDDGGQPKKRNMNPNVAIELGYALHARGDERVVMVLNTHYGDPGSLPFDIVHKRHPITFHLPPNSDEPTVASASAKLTGHLVRALRPYINLRDEVPSQQSAAVYFSTTETLVTLHNAKRDAEYLYPDSIGFYLRLLPAPRSHPNFSRDILLSKIRDADLHPFRNGPRMLFAANSYGAIAFEPDSSTDGLIASSTQVFLNGEIWGIASWLLKTGWGGKFVPARRVEEVYKGALPKYLQFSQHQLGLKPPYIVEAGAVGLRGRSFLVDLVGARTKHQFFDDDIKVRKRLPDLSSKAANGALSELFEMLFKLSGASRPPGGFDGADSRPSHKPRSRPKET
jgi:hypothetical protein